MRQENERLAKGPNPPNSTLGLTEGPSDKKQIASRDASKFEVKFTKQKTFTLVWSVAGHFE